MDFHEVLYQLRTKKKLSQEGVADVIGVDYSTYARYESGKTSIKWEHAEKLADFYNLSMDELRHYGDEDFVAQDPLTMYDRRRSITVSVELDGEQSTLDYWIDRIKKINALVF